MKKSSLLVKRKAHAAAPVKTQAGRGFSMKRMIAAKSSSVQKAE